VSRPAHHRWRKIVTTRLRWTPNIGIVAVRLGQSRRLFRQRWWSFIVVGNGSSGRNGHGWFLEWCWRRFWGLLVAGGRLSTTFVWSQWSLWCQLNNKFTGWKLHSSLLISHERLDNRRDMITQSLFKQIKDPKNTPYIICYPLLKCLIVRWFCGLHIHIKFHWPKLHVMEGTLYCIGLCTVLHCQEVLVLLHV